MPTIRYCLLNVFAETAFGGNPLAVIEDGSGLSDEEMQAVARQFNLSETTFLFPSTRAAAHVRIFTPTYEMAFAGHPTLGSANVVRALFGAGDRFELEMKAGLIPVQAHGDRWSLRANPPAYRKLDASCADLAAMLNLPREAIGGSAMWVDCGAEQPMILLTSVEYVHACRPDAVLMQRHSVNTAGQAKTYVFARTPDGFESRYFWMSGGGVNEDPGTGSACANLGGWWLATEGDKALTAIVRQGTLIKRPNVLSLDVSAGQVHVGGRVVELGRGTLGW